MNRLSPVASLLLLALATPTIALQPPPPAPPDSSAERWVRQLENEIEHLQEDLYYERRSDSRELEEQAEQALRAVTHFHQVLQRGSDWQHLKRDFEEMDRQVHPLISRLNESNDSWLRRQASRIRYPDQQLHYILQTQLPEREALPREVLARHAHVLESEAKNLRDLLSRSHRGDDRVRDAAEEFAEEAEHFHQVVEAGGDREHLRDDFHGVDEAWHRAVDRLNRSSYSIYVRRIAQNVNRVHNQIHDMLAAEHSHAAARPPEPRQRTEPQIERRVERPAIQFEIPGLGRFTIPQ